ncbi:hypothetical protein C8R48DRAFT_705487 [Suillus tomentosus]|nr:hypothetical protein C8R48DRAFT_705487 [Suillus tomentosus]
MGCRGFNVFASVMLSLDASSAAGLPGLAESLVWPEAGEATLFLLPMASIVTKGKIGGISSTHYFISTLTA